VFVVSEAGGPRHTVLLDFGIAKELWAPASTTTQDGGVRGTPAYMAPERFFGQPAGVATDIYELAVTLYAMLAGRLPWDDLFDPEARLSPRPLEHVPGELDIEIRRALSTRAQNRPATARDLLEAVHRAAGATSLPGEPAPGAAETARLRQAANAPAPWFAGRQATSERDAGKTPLAWVPTEAQSPPAAPARRRRWPVIIAGCLAVGGIAAAVVAARLDESRDAEPQEGASAVIPVIDAAIEELGSADQVAYDPDDPWAERPDDATGVEGLGDKASALRGPIELSTTGPAVAPAEARAQIAAALAHVPADTRLLFTVGLDELRANEQFDHILGKLKKQPLVSGLLSSTPPCVAAVLANAQWGVFASPSLRDDLRATLILRGRWTRADIEQCFAPDSEPLAMPDGARMLQLRRVGWIDFLDEHTLYLSVREDLAAAQVHQLVRGGTGPAAQTKRLLAKLPADHTLGIVIDGTSGFEWPKDYLPAGSHATAWLRVGTYSELEVVADARSVAAATALVARVRPHVDEVFGSKESAILGTLKVERVGTAMRVRGTLSSLLVGMIGAQIP
jgi:hypothetical protein